MNADTIQRTAVIGGGVMGAGFAHILAQAGCRVWVVDLDEQALRRCMGRVSDSLSLFLQNDLLSRDQVEPILGRIETTTSLEEAVSDAQFVIEAVLEVLDVKQDVFERLDRHAPKEAILATNTSGMKVGDIAARVSRSERVVGSHFFYPHTIVPLVEVAYGPKTSDEVVETAVAFWKRCGKEPVICRKDTNGFLVNRLQSALAREAMSVVSKGIASTQDVDKALRLGLGIRLPLVGTLEQRDWGGLDSHFSAAISIYPTLEDTKVPLPIIAEKVDRGEIGAKAGKGFYDWTGKDVDALRRKKQQQLIALAKALKEIMPEEEELVENR
jgi:3-hydroxybutyryl-CoA dehydrogenase